MLCPPVVFFTLANLACLSWTSPEPAASLPFPLVAACESAGISPNKKAIVDRMALLVPNATVLEHWDRSIRQLGDPDFGKREEATLHLMTQGPALRGRLLAAQASNDPEIARRAEEIAQSLPFRQQEAWLESAVAWLSQTPDPFLHSWLLAYLPWVEQTEPAHTSRWLVSRLLECSTRLNQWEWVSQVQRSSAPLLRLAAIQCPLWEQETAGTSLPPFSKEPDCRIRFIQANRKFALQVPEAAKELARLLAVLPEGEALQAEEMLQSIAGPDANGRVALLHLGKMQRETCSKAWQEWLEKPSSLSAWTHGAGEKKKPGRTLVVEFDGAKGGRIQEMGADWKPLWSMEGLSGPNSVQFLPGGNLLIAERTACRVTERSPSGRICWEQSLSAGPISAIRTPYGSTVVATFQEVVELDAVGRELRKHHHSSGFREVQATPEGLLRCVTGDGHIQFLNEAWQVVESIKPERHGQGAAYWASVTSLDSDKLLVSLGGTGRLVEIDKKGKISWEAAIPAVVHSQRLPNGNTLVCSFDGRALVEVDAAGKEVGRLALEGRPFLAIRR